MKTVCIYHSIDLDGWMSAAIVKHWWKSLYYDVNNVHNIEENGSLLLRSNFSNEERERLDFIGYNYGQPIPDLSEYDKVIMCDVSFPKEEMRKLFEQKNKFVWIDHHISAIKEVGRVVPMMFTENVSVKFAACELTWKYFFPNETMPEIVRLLGRYDCFGHKGTEEEELVLGFQYGARQKISNYEEAHEWLTMCLDHPEICNEIQNAGDEIYKYLCTEAKQAYKNGFAIHFRNDIKRGCVIENGILKFICINKERFNPINFGIDYHKDGYNGAACFYFDGTHWCFSLYNDNGLVDCSQIAKQFGGGGHKGAAGFIINDITKILNNEYSK